MYFEPTVADRVERADTIALLYERTSGLYPPEVATDVLADLMHWCTANSVDFVDVLATAEMHYGAEQAEEAAH